MSHVVVVVAVAAPCWTTFNTTTHWRLTFIYRPVVVVQSMEVRTIVNQISADYIYIVEAAH